MRAAREGCSEPHHLSHPIIGAAGALRLRIGVLGCLLSLSSLGGTTLGVPRPPRPLLSPTPPFIPAEA